MFIYKFKFKVYTRNENKRFCNDVNIYNKVGYSTDYNHFYKTLTICCFIIASSVYQIDHVLEI